MKRPAQVKRGSRRRSGRTPLIGPSDQRGQEALWSASSPKAGRLVADNSTPAPNTIRSVLGDGM
jgi:hypothetical protein